MKCPKNAYLKSWTFSFPFPGKSQKKKNFCTPEVHYPTTYLNKVSFGTFERLKNRNRSLIKNSATLVPYWVVMRGIKIKSVYKIKIQQFFKLLFISFCGELELEKEAFYAFYCLGVWTAFNRKAGVPLPPWALYELPLRIPPRFYFRDMLPRGV